MTCTQERERERERENASVPLFFLFRFAKRLDFRRRKKLCVKKKNFFTSKAHPAVIKNDMVK